MDDSYGGFSRDITFVGKLQGEGLYDGAMFYPEDSSIIFDNKIGVGNRVNLYIVNKIRYKEENPPEYGLILNWHFKSAHRRVVNATPNNSGDEFWGSMDNLGYRSWAFNPMYSEYQNPLNANTCVKAKESYYNFISIPNKEANSSKEYFYHSSRQDYLVFPVVALADFLKVYFYSMPIDYEYTEFDYMSIWSCPGHDAQGSSHEFGFK